ncbi:MAG: hypothetical protein JWO52_5206, partial [Gammaproteobacteria bacterium]|nr:hypothetical protein [Gammaproteobacteria bacterium]
APDASNLPEVLQNLQADRDRYSEYLALVAEVLPDVQNVIVVPLSQKEDLQRFLMGLSTAWQAGEVRPTHLNRNARRTTGERARIPSRRLGPPYSPGSRKVPSIQPRRCSAGCKASVQAYFQITSCAPFSVACVNGACSEHDDWSLGSQNGATAAGLTSLTHALIDEQP